MSDCELLGACDFQGRDDRAQKVMDLLKGQYCQGDPSACARRMIALAVGEDRIPWDLYPNETHAARRIIECE